MAYQDAGWGGGVPGKGSAPSQRRIGATEGPGTQGHSAALGLGTVQTLGVARFVEPGPF